MMVFEAEIVMLSSTKIKQHKNMSKWSVHSSECHGAQSMCRVSVRQYYQLLLNVRVADEENDISFIHFRSVFQ